MSENWYSVLKGAGVAAAGAALAVVVQAASSGDLGVYGPVVGAVAAVLLNVIRKFAVAPLLAATAAGLFLAGPAAAQCPGGVCPVPTRPIVNPAWAVPQAWPGGVGQATTAGCSSGCSSCPAVTCGVAGTCGQPGCGVAGPPLASPVRGLIGRLFPRRR